MKLNGLCTETNQEPSYYYTLPFGVAEIPYVRITATASFILRIEPSFSPLPVADIEHHPALRDAMAAYVAGDPVMDWPVSVALSGSPFFFACRRELARIPYGETISYSMLADRAGNPKAIRAAASACARNPLPLLIPCHRVIAKTGGLGGFAWGLPVKKHLLAMEAGHHHTLAAA